MSESNKKTQELVEKFVAGHSYAIESDDKRILERLVVNNEKGNWFSSDGTLFPPELFAGMVAFVEQKYVEVLKNITAAEFKKWSEDGGTLKAEFSATFCQAFLEKLALVLFEPGSTELNPFFANLFAEANKSRVEQGSPPLMLTEELKLDLFKRYTVLCGVAIQNKLKFQQLISDNLQVNEEELSMLEVASSTIVDAITGNSKGRPDECRDFFDKLQANKKHFVPKTTFLGSASHKKLSEIEDENLKGYVESRALFERSLEDYKAMQAALNRDSGEEFQARDPIYTAGQKLLADTDKTAEAVDAEGIGHLATVLEYATEKLQDAIDSKAENKAVLRPAIARAKGCSDERYNTAMDALESKKHDKVVFSAMRFLEVVATAIVNGFLLAVTAIANSAPALTFVPPATAPHVDLPPSPATRRKEKMSYSLGCFFTELRQRSAAPSLGAAILAQPKQPSPVDSGQSSSSVAHKSDKGKEKEEPCYYDKKAIIPISVMAGGPGH